MILETDDYYDLSFYHNHNYHVFHFELEYLVQTQVIIPTVVIRAIS